ncbi:MAG: response regulator transcription factor [Pseudomonadota bacterium]|jgi:DNA-binding response OmpR family regulator
MEFTMIHHGSPAASPSKDPGSRTWRVLIIEDQQDVAQLVGKQLADQLSCKVKLVSDGAAGLALAETRQFDLIILDVMLPAMDGLEVCKRLRASGNRVPILMLTARSSDLDRVLGLELGADDYLAKPFQMAELVARVKALFRRIEAFSRPEADGAPEPVQVGDLVIDPSRRQVSVGGTPVELTAKEFDLLLYFARNPGRVYTRAQLLDAVWGYGHEGYEHAVNCMINRLRAKIERNPASPRYLITVRGAGYKLSEQV